MSENKLLQCPFCGGEAELFETHEGQFGIIHSNSTYICPISDSESFQGDWTYDTQEEAIEAWNSRKPIDDILKSLKNKIHPLHNPNWNSAIEEAIEIIKEGE